MTPPLTKHLNLLLLGALIAACAPVGPNYTPPETNASKQWYAPLKGGLAEKDGDDSALSTWWKTLNDPILTSLEEQALIQYQDTVLTALEKVENALVAYAEEQNRMKALEASTKAAKRAVLLSKSQYKAGLTDFTNVLDAQRALLSFEEQLARSKGKVTSNLVRLYKALGGGWTSF